MWQAQVCLSLFRILHASFLLCISTPHQIHCYPMILTADLNEQDLEIFDLALWGEYSCIQIHSLLTLNIIQVHIFPVHSFVGNVTQMTNPYKLMGFIFGHLCCLLPRKSLLPLLLSFYWHSWQVRILLDFLLFYLLLLLVSPL